jgi:hypothetical protein
VLNTLRWPAHYLREDGNVANSVDVVCTLDLKVFVDLHATVLLDFYPAALEELGCGLDTDTEDHDIGWNLLAINHHGTHSRRILGRRHELLNLGLQVEGDSLALVELLQTATDLLTEVLATA